MHPRPGLRIALASAITVFLISACDSAPTSPPSECISASASVETGAALDADPTPWEEMSDEELTRAIRERAIDDQVFVGFKDAGKSRGVTESGTVVVSEEVVGRMTAWLRAQGIEIVRSYSLIPAVVGRIQPTVRLVCTIRNHPNVDYLEPVISGDRAGLDGASGSET